MSELSSHLGNRYNYYAGAFLKTHRIGYGGEKELNLTKHDFDIPLKIPAESCTFGLALSLDLVASMGDSEYFAECKYSDDPKPLKANSTEFKEALLEYIGLERYRKLSFRRQIEYLFITNNPTRILCQEIEGLQRATSEALSAFSIALEETARRKWTHFQARIEESQLRSALGRVIVIEIDKGALMEAQIKQDFQEALHDIAEKVAKKGIAPHFAFPASETSTITVVGDENESKFIELQKLGYALRVSDRIVNAIRVLLQTAGQLEFQQFDGSKLKFLGTMHVDAPKSAPYPVVRRIVTEMLNDLFKSEQSYGNVFVVISPEQRLLLLINQNWLLERAKSCTTNRGVYRLAMIASDLGVTVSDGVLKLAIIEANRLNGVIIDQGWFEDQ